MAIITAFMDTLHPKRGAPGKWGILEAITAWIVIAGVVILILHDKEDGLLKLVVQLGPVLFGGAYLGYRTAKNERKKRGKK